MKYTVLLPFAAAASAFVIPDEAIAKKLIIETERKAEETLSAWSDRVPSLGDVRSFAKDAFDDAYDAFERQASKLNAYLPDIEFEPEIPDFLSSSAGDSEKPPGRGRRGQHRGARNLTVYQVIHASNYTKKFAALVDEYPEMVETLNATEANVTLFVPTDRAFEKLPDHHHHKKPPKEFVEKLVRYHVVPGFYPAGRVLAQHTLPTALKEGGLGDNPQRIRVSIGIFGVRLNFYSKVVAVNVFTKNGIIHGLDSLLVPPPPAGKLISLFPPKFSTLLLAAEKTGLRGAEHPATTGLTVFAPTNGAFEKLGPAANAFLFNTERGLGYLRALLCYHVVANETLYSDEYYPKPDAASGSEGEVETDGSTENGHHHLDLPTLLGGRPLSVDVARFHRIVTMTVNGRTRVSVQDALAEDGVVHVVDSILVPPRKHKKEEEEEEEDGEIEVDELIERLEPIATYHQYEPESESESNKDEWVGEL